MIRVATSADAFAVTNVINEAFLTDAFFKNEKDIYRFRRDGTEIAELITTSKELFFVYEEQESILGAINVHDGCELRHGVSAGTVNAALAKGQGKELRDEEALQVVEVGREEAGPSAAAKRPEMKVVREVAFGMLAVNTAAGGRGIGSKLITAVEAWAVTGKLPGLEVDGENVGGGSNSPGIDNCAKTACTEASSTTSTLPKRDKNTTTSSDSVSVSSTCSTDDRVRPPHFARISFPTMSVRPDIRAFYEKRGFSVFRTDPLPADVQQIVAPDWREKVQFVYMEKLLPLGIF
eukprot:g8914.t1